MTVQAGFYKLDESGEILGPSSDVRWQVKGVDYHLTPDSKAPEFDMNGWKWFDDIEAAYLNWGKTYVAPAPEKSPFGGGTGI
jgi:hypothetical protein